MAAHLWVANNTLKQQKIVFTSQSPTSNTDKQSKYSLSYEPAVEILKKILFSLQTKVE